MQNTQLEYLRGEIAKLRSACDFYQALTGWGSMDVETARQWIDDIGGDYGEFGTHVEDTCKEIEVRLADVDICGMALEFIVGQSKAHDLQEHLYGNYSCSQFNLSEEDAGAILAQVPKDERGTAWEWLVDFTGAEIPETAEDE